MQAIGLIGWLLLSFAAAAIGGMASIEAGDFYAQLDRPAWAPPGWVFGPVWSLLYALQGISAWLIWRQRPSAGPRRTALALFIVQLAINALWSWLFFAWHRGGLAFGEVVLLLAMIVATTAMFWRIRALAGALLIPYLLWVGFATALTYSIWQRNTHLL
jgi:tryptophan-rich sensory protein